MVSRKTFFPLTWRMFTTDDLCSWNHFCSGNELWLEILYLNMTSLCFCCYEVNRTNFFKPEALIVAEIIEDGQHLPTWEDFLDLCIFLLVLIRCETARKSHSLCRVALLKVFDVSLTFCHSPGHTLTSTHVRPHPGQCAVLLLHVPTAPASPSYGER